MNLINKRIWKIHKETEKVRDLNPILNRRQHRKANNLISLVQIQKNLKKP